MDIQRINDQAKFYFDNKQFDKALELLQRPDLPKELFGNLAKCYYYTHHAEKALEIMLSLDKDQNAWIDTALYYNALGNSEQSYQIYQTLDPSNSKVRFNLGYHLLQNNRFIEGFQHLESGIELRAWGSEYVLQEKQIINKSKRWQGQPTGTLAMVLEGGLGDEIIFLRWANYLKTKCSVLKIFCHRSLLRILINSGYDCEPIESLKHFNYDHYCPAMSLPSIASIQSPQQYVSFPYIKSFTEPFITKQLDKVAGGKKKIGIKWFGNPEFEHDQFRTVPSQALKGLSKYGQLFSLQFEDIDPNIPNCKELIKDWQDTYSVLKSLDLVVTSCTSVAHFAGAIGIKTIVLVPLVPYFTWSSNDIKWYPDNVEVIRQTRYNDWSEPVKKLYQIMESYESSY